MSLGQSIRTSSKWLVGSNVAGQVLQFAFGVILARLLVPADFGMIVTIQIFTGFVGLLASGGMGQALIRAKHATPTDFHVVFSLQLAIGTAIYATFFWVAPFFATWFHDPRYEELLRVSALSFLLRPFINLHSIWLQREMRFKETSIRSLIANAISSIASIGLAVGGFGVWSLVLGGISGSVINLALIYRLTPLHPRLRFDREIAHRHSGFGVKISLNDLISYMRHQTSNFIITTMGGAAMVGLFNKGDSLAKLPFTTISGPIYQPVFRAMSEQQDNPDKIKYLFYKMISLLIVYTLPFYIGLWWLAEPFIVVVYGQHWAEAAIPLQILAPLGMLYCIGHPCGAVLAASNRLGREMVVQAITLVLVATACYVGLNWGLAGVAIGIVISQAYATMHFYVLASRCIDTRLRDLLAATAPGLLLNATLLASLVLTDLALPAGMRQDSAPAYLLICAMTGALAYGIVFLYFPPRALVDESRRWKLRLHLARQD
jgi:O-antigen/teichoic acid export membrane protein